MQDVVLGWVNYHLQGFLSFQRSVKSTSAMEAGVDATGLAGAVASKLSVFSVDKVENFTTDLRDSEVSECSDNARALATCSMSSAVLVGVAGAAPPALPNRASEVPGNGIALHAGHRLGEPRAQGEFSVGGNCAE